MNNNEKQALHDRFVQAFADYREGFAECMDTEAAARSDKDVDLTEYDQAVEFAETIYDEPDFYEWFTDRYPGKIAEYDEAAAQMMIEAFSEGRTWDLVDEAIEYMVGNL